MAVKTLKLGRRFDSHPDLEPATNIHATIEVCAYCAEDLRENWLDEHPESGFVEEVED